MHILAEVRASREGPKNEHTVGVWFVDGIQCNAKAPYIT